LNSSKLSIFSKKVINENRVEFQETEFFCTKNDKNFKKINIFKQKIQKLRVINEKSMQFQGAKHFSPKTINEKQSRNPRK
jgi:hypothetical protein